MSIEIKRTVSVDVYDIKEELNNWGDETDVAEIIIMIAGVALDKWDLETQDGCEGATKDLQAIKVHLDPMAKRFVEVLAHVQIEKASEEGLGSDEGE